MSWIGPTGKNLIRFGPHAVELVRVGREPLEKAVRQAATNVKARRDALEEADGVTSGTLSKATWRGHRIWVVWSDGTPVSAYPREVGDPPTRVALDEAVRYADPAKRRTPDQVRADARVARARRAAGARLRRRRALP